MSAEIEIGTLSMIVDNGEVRCDDENLLATAEKMVQDMDGPTGSDPNPDLTIAVSLATQLGGTIVWFEIPRVVVDRVY